MKFNAILQHSLFKSSLIYTLCDAINKSVPFLILPLLSFYLLPADYGVIANFNVVLSIVSIFVMLGVDGAISVQYYKLDTHELSKYIFNGLVLVSLGTMMAFVFFFLFHNQVYAWVKIPMQYQLLIVLMAFASTITSINLSLWRLEDKPFKFGIYEISQTVVNIGISLFFVVGCNMGWIGRVNGIMIATNLFGAYSFFLLYRRGYLKISFSKNYIAQILFFGLPLIPHALSFWIRSGIDRIYITKYIGESATGLYATGFQFGLLVSFLTISFNNAFVPYLFKNLSELNEDRLIENKIKLVKITYGIIMGLCFLGIFFTLFSHVVINYFFSKAYVDAKDFIIWAIMAQIFQGFYLLFVNYIFFVKKTKALAIITFCCASLQFILSYLFITKMGAIGGAYSTVIVSLINFVAVAIYSNKVYSMPWFAIRLMK